MGLTNKQKLAVFFGILAMIIFLVLLWYWDRMRKLEEMEDESDEEGSVRTAFDGELINNNTLTQRISTSPSTEHEIVNQDMSDFKPIQINIVKNLESDAPENLQHAPEFLRRARSIENILQNDDHPVLQSFVLNEIPHFVQLLVKNKKKIQETMDNIENGSIELDGEKYSDFDGEIVYELNKKNKAFGYDLSDQFEDEHEYIMEAIIESNDPDQDKEFVVELRNLYQHHVTAYHDQNQRIIREAIKMQKNGAIPEDEEMTESEYNDIETDTDTDPISYHPDFTNSISNDVDSDFQQKTKQKPDYTLIIAIIAWVVVMILVVVVLLTKKKEWVQQNRGLVVGIFLLFSSIGAVFFYYFFYYSNEEKMDDSHRTPKDESW